MLLFHLLQLRTQTVLHTIVETEDLKGESEGFSSLPTLTYVTYGTSSGFWLEHRTPIPTYYVVCSIRFLGLRAETSRASAMAAKGTTPPPTHPHKNPILMKTQGEVALSVMEAN